MHAQEEGVVLRPRVVTTPGPRLGVRSTPSIVGDGNLLSPRTRISLPLHLGPLSVSAVGGLAGEGGSSCGHPRETMNLFRVRRIS